MIAPIRRYIGRLSGPQLAAVWFGLLAVCVAALILLGVVGQRAGALTLSIDAARAKEVLDDPNAGNLTAAFLLDLAFIPIYVIFLNVWITVAIRRFYVVRGLQRLGYTFGIVALIAGAFDAAENLLFIWVIKDYGWAGRVANDTLVAAGGGVALAKWIALIVILLYLLPATVWIAWRHLTGWRWFPDYLRVQDLPRPGGPPGG